MLSGEQVLDTIIIIFSITSFFYFYHQILDITIFVNFYYKIRNSALWAAMYFNKVSIYVSIYLSNDNDDDGAVYDDSDDNDDDIETDDGRENHTIA